eukprot:4885582-Pyramimonas_sp.AAC.1
MDSESDRGRRSASRSGGAPDSSRDPPQRARDAPRRRHQRPPQDYDRRPARAPQPRDDRRSGSG